MLSADRSSVLFGFLKCDVAIFFQIDLVTNNTQNDIITERQSKFFNPVFDL